MKPANFLLRVESQSTGSTSGASAPSPSAAAAVPNAKINYAPGVAGEVDSAAAVSATLRLGIVAIDYGDHFDLAALS